jgi:hypothetical protein
VAFSAVADAVWVVTYRSSPTVWMGSPTVSWRRWKPEAAVLVTDEAGERVVHVGADADGVSHRRRVDGRDHELLEVEGVRGARAAVEDVAASAIQTPEAAVSNADTQTVPMHRRSRAESTNRDGPSPRDKLESQVRPDAFTPVQTSVAASHPPRHGRG